MKTTFQCKW